MHKHHLNCVNKGINVFYMDTDNLVIDKPLSSELIGPAIQQFKLECDPEIEKALFINTKSYGLKWKDKEVVKFKGTNLDTVNFSHLELLYNENPGWIRNEKFRSERKFKGIKFVEKNLKREKIYENGIWVDTKPIKIN